ncbi:MAG: hypothetical protein MUF54_24160 [Polyangiaceae bacterium]|nr:hypothetical protein [Polyangiaceae bacterium]
MTVKDAIRIVRAHVRKHPNDAVEVIGWIAGDAGLDIWLPTSDAGADVGALGDLLHSRLHDLTVDDHEAAKSSGEAVKGHIGAVLDVAPCG